jgi:hypothetical protein
MTEKLLTALALYQDPRAVRGPVPGDVGDITDDAYEVELQRHSGRALECVGQFEAKFRKPFVDRTHARNLHRESRALRWQRSMSAPEQRTAASPVAVIVPG